MNQKIPNKMNVDNSTILYLFSKLVNHSQGRPEGSLFNSYYTIIPMGQAFGIMVKLKQSRERSSTLPYTSM